MTLLDAFYSTQTYIANNIGQKFVEPPPLDINDIYLDSTPKTPLIFVLSPGVDPNRALFQLAEKYDMSSRFQYLSLGQGQSPKATRMLQERYLLIFDN